MVPRMMVAAARSSRDSAACSRQEPLKEKGSWAGAEWNMQMGHLAQSAESGSVMWAVWSTEPGTVWETLPQFPVPSHRGVL